MKYSVKNTKAELISLLDSQKHLAEAVEAKDEEISNLNKQLLELNKKQESDKAAQIKSVKEAQEKEKITLEEFSSIKKNNELLVIENKKLANSLNSYIQAFRNLMKSMQSSLDNSIELEALLFEKLQSRQGANK